MTAVRALVAMGLLVGCSEPVASEVASEIPWIDPDQPGLYDAGVETIDIVDARGKELRLEVWYPAIAEPEEEPDPYTELPYAFEAYRYAPEDRRGAPYPLVAFSHGMGGIRYQNAYLTEHLARHGFVVVAPDHPGSVLIDIDWDRMDQVILQRPDDVRYAVDEVLQLAATDHKRLGGLIRLDEGYGMLGHSFGAYTTLVVAGGVLDYQGLVRWCEENGGDGCSYVDMVDPDEVPLHGGADPRVVVSVPMSPGIWYAFGEDGSGLEHMVQSIILTGDDDDVLDYLTEARPVYEHMAAPKAMGTLLNAGHYALTNLCDLMPVFEDCIGPEGGYLDPAIAQDIAKTVVTAFLGWHLYGDERYGEWLDPASLAVYPDLVWEVETAR